MKVLAFWKMAAVTVICLSVTGLTLSEHSVCIPESASELALSSLHRLGWEGHLKEQSDPRNDWPQVHQTQDGGGGL